MKYRTCHKCLDWDVIDLTIKLEQNIWAVVVSCDIVTV